VLLKKALLTIAFSTIAFQGIVFSADMSGAIQRVFAEPRGAALVATEIDLKTLGDSSAVQGICAHYLAAYLSGKSLPTGDRDLIVAALLSLSGVGDAKKTVRDLKKVTVQNDAVALLTAAHMFLSGADYAKTLLTVNQALSADKDDYAAMFVRARLYAKNGMPALAQYDFASVVELKPDFKVAYQELLVLLSNAGARDAVDEAMRMAAQNNVIIDGAERIEEKTSEKKSALRPSDDTESDPSTLTLKELKLRCWSYYRKDFLYHDDAKKDFAFLMSIAPDYLEVYSVQAQVFMRWGQYDEAEETMNLAEEKGVKDFNTYFWRASARIQLEKYSDAEKDLKRAIELKPSDPEAKLKLAFVYRKMGRVADSDAAYKGLAAEGEALPEALYGNAMMFEEQKEYALAKDFYEKFLDAAGDNEAFALRCRRAKIKIRDMEYLSKKNKGVSGA